MVKAISRKSKIKLAAVGLFVIVSMLGSLILADFGHARWFLRIHSYVYTAVKTVPCPPPSDYTGVWKQYWINGAPQAEFQVQDGVKCGKYLSWYDNGVKCAEGSYADGRRNGEWIQYHANGRKWLEPSYKQGREHGFIKEWDFTGHLESFIWKHNGYPVISMDTRGIPADFTGIWERKGLHGGPEEIGIKAGVLHGRFVAWYNNGRKAAEGFFRDGVPDGLMTLWYEDGRKMHEASYNDGVQHGNERSWGYHGKLIRCAWWYEGRPLSEEHFKQLTEHQEN